jgi:hypothetical protein
MTRRPGPVELLASEAAPALCRKIDDDLDVAGAML